MDIKEAYELAAPEYRKKYDANGPRTEDVDKIFSLTSTRNPLIVEIGCAYGRDAKHMLTKTKRYIGIDISETYIAMARTEVPEGEFYQCDVREFEFPSDVDVVVAFASLLHLSKEELKAVLERVCRALSPSGVVFLSLKRRDEYDTQIETDEFVSRRFYYYTRETLLEIMPTQLQEVHYEEQGRKEPWLTMILQKVE